jgi:hypothetical protein
MFGFLLKNENGKHNLFFYSLSFSAQEFCICCIFPKDMEKENWFF